jgi:hypothetical protein
MLNYLTGPEQGDALSLLLFNFVVGYANMVAQGEQMELT